MTPKDTPRLRTARLELIAAWAGLVHADLVRLNDTGDPAALGRLLAARVPEAWPPLLLRDALAFFAQNLAADPRLTGWHLWYWVRAAAPGEPDRVLIGSGGFKNRPDPQGSVELGYSLLDEFFHQGYAAEAVRATLTWAFAHPAVRQVTAQTFPDLPASMRLLERLGFQHDGPGDEPGALRFVLPRHCWRPASPPAP